MFRFEDKLINASLVAWVGDVQKVRRWKPKADKVVENELPPVFNFSFKVGFDTYKSTDFENESEAIALHDSIIQEVKS